MRRDKDYYIAKAFALCVAEVDRKVCTKPSDLYDYLKPYSLADQEHFLGVYLDGAGQIIELKVITKGLLNRTLVHPREVFRPAILANANSVILSHNHPSGVLEPSREDRDATDQLVRAGKILGIELLDHIITSPLGFVSFREKGIMP